METVFLFGKPQATAHRARGPQHPIFEKPLPQQRRTAAQRTEMPPPSSGQTAQAPGSPGAGAGQSPGTMGNRAQGHLHREHHLRGPA